MQIFKIENWQKMLLKTTNFANIDRICGIIFCIGGLEFALLTYCQTVSDTGLLGKFNLSDYGEY